MLGSLGVTVGQAAIDAVSLGCLYALFALGIALIFGVMGLINFAHGELRDDRRLPGRLLASHRAAVARDRR